LKTCLTHGIYWNMWNPCDIHSFIHRFILHLSTHLFVCQTYFQHMIFVCKMYNYEWTNFKWFSLVVRHMLNLWCTPRWGHVCVEIIYPWVFWKGKNTLELRWAKGCDLLISGVGKSHHHCLCGQKFQERNCGDIKGPITLECTYSDVNQWYEVNTFKDIGRKVNDELMPLWIVKIFRCIKSSKTWARKCQMMIGETRIQGSKEDRKMGLCMSRWARKGHCAKYLVKIPYITWSSPNLGNNFTCLLFSNKKLWMKDETNKKYFNGY
jgi:hypothetical protein